MRATFVRRRPETLSLPGVTDTEYAAACQTVAAALTEAFPSYVDARLPAANLAGMDEALEQGMTWLRAELTQWAGRRPADQRRGPLQIFQTAMAFPTAALEAAGVPAPQRSEAEARALPGDTYRLAPGSSRDIDDATWKAHVAWGIAKARVVADVVPRTDAGAAAGGVAVVTMSQAHRDAIYAVAGARGLVTRHWRNPGAIAAGLEAERPRWAVVDGNHKAADEAVRRLGAAGSRVLVFTEDPDDIALARWKSLGADAVAGHSEVSAVLERWLPVQA